MPIICIYHLHYKAGRDAGQKILCRMLCLWSLRHDLEQISGDPVAIGRNWATDIIGYGIDNGHHMAEENPADLAKAIASFVIG